MLSSYLQAPATNLLYGRTGWLRPGGRAPVPFKDGPEQALFLGFVAMLLAAAGALAAPRGLKRIAAVYAVLALVGVVLSLGPDGIRALYAAMYGALFGMDAIRAPARFSVLTLLGVAMLAALAVRALELRGARAGRFAGAAALGLIAVEFCNGAIAFPAPPALTTAAGRWLREQPGSGAVVCAPMGPFAGNTPCMLQSLEHGRPIVNGYSGLRPPFFEALLDAVNRLPAPQALVTLHDLGVEFVVSDGPLEIGPESRDALVERASFGAAAHLSGRVVARDRHDVHGGDGRRAARARAAAIRRRRVGDLPRALDERPDERARGRRHDCRPAAAGRRKLPVSAAGEDGALDVALLRSRCPDRDDRQRRTAATQLPRGDYRREAPDRTAVGVRRRRATRCD